LALLFYDSKHVVLTDDDVLCAFYLYFGTSILRDKYAVPGLDGKAAKLSIVVEPTFTYSNYAGDKGFFFGRVGDDDPTLGFFLRLEAADQKTVIQWANFHLDLLIK